MEVPSSSALFLVNPMIDSLLLASLVAFQFTPLPASEAVKVVYGACAPETPYVLSRAAGEVVLGNFVMPEASCSQAFLVLEASLRAEGLSLDRSGSVHRVFVPGEDVPPRPISEVYRPRFVAVAELQQMVSDALPDDVRITSGSARKKNPAALVLTGSPRPVSEALKILSALDRPQEQFSVEVLLFEVQAGSSKGRSFAAVLEAFSGSLSVQVGQPTAGNVVELNVGGIDALVSLLDDSVNYRSLARPSLLVREGQESRFFSGEERRVAGSVVLDAQGNPVQSVESVTAGKELLLQLRRLEDSLLVDLEATISQFIGRDANSATRATRELEGSWLAQPGKVYVLAGLDSELESSNASGFLGLPVGRYRQKDRGQLWLAFQVAPGRSQGQLDGEIGSSLPSALGAATTPGSRP